MPLLRIRSHIGNVSSSIGSSLMPFDLDISGVAGFFGGDATLAAMNTINVYAGRRWMGWYNQPGTYEVAKTYGQLAVSPFWDAVYPGPNLDPATLFKFDKVEKSAKYSYAHRAANDHSTSYLARLVTFIEECRAMRSVGKPPAHHGGASPLGSVTLVELPDSEELRNIEIPAKVTSMRQSPAMIFAAFTTMFLSCAAAAGCAVLRDWPCFAMIVLGMATNGIAHLVLSGSALAFETPEMVDNPEAPRAGVLYHGNDLVVLAGPKGALRAITKGHYTLVYTHSSHYHSVGVCSAILSLQFLAQLLVVPQGELRGQLLFLGSLAVSWVYNFPIPLGIGLACEKWLGHVNPGAPGFVRSFPWVPL